MRRLVAVLIAVSVVLGLGITTVEARGGRGSADCPTGSKDPDCQ